MICCSKCKEIKSIDQYDTYWHSTQGKMRTRKYCKACFNLQKKIYRELIKSKKITQPVEDLTPPVPIIEEVLVQPEGTHLCSRCNEYKTDEHYYFNKRKKDGKKVYRSHLCRECATKESRSKYAEHKVEKGGSMMIGQLPNSYFDEYQKKNTFELMTLLGYLFDEPTGIWYKPGVKEIVDGKPVFLKIKEYQFKTKPLTVNEIRWIIKYREEGMRIKEIANIMGRSIGIIHNKLKEHGNA